VTADSASLDPTTIRAVAFDGYGTLFDYDTPQFRRDVAIILAEQRAEPEDFDAFFETWIHSYGPAGVWGEEGPSRERPHDEHVLNGPLPDWHSSWEIWRRQFARAFEAHGVPGDPDAAADHLRTALSHADTYSDAHDTIEELARRGYLLGLLSNADEDFLQAALSKGRLRFSVIQSSESLRAYKPHRAIFTALCGRLDCAPSEVLYVGDSPIADVNGARNAGLRTAWIRRTEAAYSESLPPPDLTLERLTDLLDTLQGAS
jgi:2-haloalkanoic acid dehalogenase type II